VKSTTVVRCDFRGQVRHVFFQLPEVIKMLTITTPIQAGRLPRFWC
jgi:hypothetical protein